MFSCLTAQPFADPREELARALTSPVRWRETMVALAAHGATSFIDVGPEQVLARLVARNVEGPSRRSRSRSSVSATLEQAADHAATHRARARRDHRARQRAARPRSCPTPRSTRRSASRTTGSSGAPGSASAATPSPARNSTSWPPGRRAALADAGIDGAQVDLVLVASCSQDSVMPNAAPQVAHALGARTPRRSTSAAPAPASSPRSRARARDGSKRRNARPRW